MKMKTNKDLLGSILKTTQMGQLGIRSVEKRAESEEMKQALSSQLREYDKIEQEAQDIAKIRGWVLPETSNGVRAMQQMTIKMQLNGKRTDSKIAGMMIQGNTRGVIKGLKNLHQFTNKDNRVDALAQKLLDRENENIEQMKPFL
jgi:hypothetical protein